MKGFFICFLNYKLVRYLYYQIYHSGTKKSERVYNSIRQLIQEEF